LVCGIVGAIFGLIPILGIPALALGLVAFVLGFMGRGRAKRDPTAGRKGAATAGIILGVIAIALGIAGLVIVNDTVNDLDRSLSNHCLNNPNAPDCP
jgi:Na+/proline symporter